MDKLTALTLTRSQEKLFLHGIESLIGILWFIYYFTAPKTNPLDGNCVHQRVPWAAKIICGFRYDLEVIDFRFNHFWKSEVTAFLRLCNSFSFRFSYRFILFLRQAIIDDIKDNKPQKDIINDVKELSAKNIIPEHEVIGIVSINDITWR